MKINLLDNEEKQENIIQRPIRLWHFLFLFPIPILILIAVFFWSPRLVHRTRVFAGAPNQTAWTHVRDFVSSLNDGLRNQFDDRINILILGKGGALHDGPNLTDTIMLASLAPRTGEVALLSIPRDLSVDMGKWGMRKINEANALAEAENPGSGGAAAEDIVQNTFRIPIHHYITADFNGFEDIINTVGGLDIYIERPFSDTSFPTLDFKTRTVAFAKGWEHMNGARALDYTRSRHGTNNEDSDFARARRQQIILLALKEKILSREVLLNPATITRVLVSLLKYVTTDIGVNDIAKFVTFAATFDAKKIQTHVLEAGPGGVLEAGTNESGQYILEPKHNNWNALQDIARHIFDYDTILAKYVVLPARIEIQNGTKQTGLATTIAEKLKADDFFIAKVGNGPSDGFIKTIVYDYTNGKKNDALKKLKAVLPRGAVTIKTKRPEDAKDSTLDFLVVLGEDSIN